MNHSQPSVLVSWVKTSTVHAYPVTQYSGTLTECEQRRAASNFPEKLSIHPQGQVPAAY